MKFGQMGNTVTPNAPIALSNVIKTLFLFRPLPYMTWSNLSVSLISPPAPSAPPVEAKRTCPPEACPPDGRRVWRRFTRLWRVYPPLEDPDIGTGAMRSEIN